MRYRTIALAAMLLAGASAANAQTAQTAPAEESKPTLQQQLMPEAATTLMAPASAEATRAIESSNETSAAMPRGAGTGLIIAGGGIR